MNPRKQVTVLINFGIVVLLVILAELGISLRGGEGGGHDRGPPPWTRT